jgi:predicted dehydrogenase
VNHQQGEVLRFGLIGAGRIAHAYVAAFQEIPNARLVGICDTDFDAASTMAASIGCPAYSYYEEMLEDTSNGGAIDAAIVATPPSTHGGICLDLLKRGIPVLCEKPVSFDLGLARLIRRTAREQGVLFTMASKFRYAEDVVRARGLVDSGILGDVVLFENTFMSYVAMAGRWNSDRKVSGGGVFIDNGTHSVDIMRYFIGPLNSINVVVGPSIQGLPVEETVHVTARAGGGAVGRMDLSWSINKQCDDYIALYGTEGTLRVGWKASLFRQTGNSRWVQFGNGYDKVQAFRAQIANFSAAIQGRARLTIDADDAIASVEVIQAGYQSLALDSWTRIAAGETTAAEVQAA